MASQDDMRVGNAGHYAQASYAWVDTQAPAGGGQGLRGQGLRGQSRVRRFRRPRLRWRTRLLLGFAAVIALWLLIGFSLPHNGLLIAALILMLGMMGLVAGLVIGLLLLGRRVVRRAVRDGLPGLIDTAWLGRTMGAGRYERTGARSGTTR
jgi:hypothetical protein